MKTRNRVARKAGLVGAGIGLTLFALVGLLQGSLIGGAIGLGIVNTLMGEPAGASLLSRVVVAASMLAGVVVAGIVFVGVSSSAGWLLGYLAGWLVEPRPEAAYDEHKSGVR